MNKYDPYLYYKLAGGVVVGAIVYWRIWKINGRVANFIVFGLAFGLFCYVLDWDYILNHYFRVTQWNLP